MQYNSKRMKFYCLFILSAFCMVGCRQDDYNAILTHTKKLLIEAPDSALTLLQTIDRHSLRGKRAKAEYALLYTQALDKNYIDVDNDSLIRVAVDYFQNHGTYIDKAKVNYYYGVIHYNALNIDEAMEFFVKASIHVEKTADQYFRGLIYGAIGNLYYDQYSFAEAVKMYSNAAAAFSAVGNNNNLLMILRNKGLALMHMQEQQDAIKCLTKAKTLAIEQQNVPTLLNIILSLYGLCAQNSNDSLSLNKIKTDLFNTYKAYNQNTIPIEHYPIIGNIYYKENQIDSARYYCKKYLDKIPNITLTNIGILAILSSIESKSKNYKSALEYEKLLGYYTDSINNIHNNHLIQSLERKYKTEYFQKSYEVLQVKHKYVIISSVLVISMIMLISCILISTHRRSIKIKNQEIGEYEEYVNEVQSHYADLRIKYNNIIKNMNVQDVKSQALFGILDNRIRGLQLVLDLASRYGSDPGKFYIHFKNHLKLMSGKTSKLTEDIIAIANLSCYGIITKMEELYPSLSHHELCYCGFICLEFSSENIRILYNHTNTYSIYTMRSKIRSKLGVTNNSFNLEVHIRNLMEKLKEERFSVGHYIN